MNRPLGDGFYGRLNCGPVLFVRIMTIEPLVAVSLGGMLLTHGFKEGDKIDRADRVRRSFTDTI